MSLLTLGDDTFDQCGRCEGWCYTTVLEDGICQACYREMNTLNMYQVDTDGMMPISVKMYYDHFKWHFEKEIKDKMRGTRLVFTPFSIAALEAFREYMMVANPQLYIPHPKQTVGKRGGNKKAWRMVVEDCTHFSTAMSDPDRDRFRQSLTGEVRSDAYLSWIPPLAFVVTVHMKRGREFGACVISSGAARMTGMGFSYAPRIPNVKVLSKIQSFLSLSVFGLQQERMDENTRRGVEAPPLTMLPHSLLLMASRHA